MPKVNQQKSPSAPKPIARQSTEGLSVVDRIGPMSFDDGIKIALYGRSGTGKTTLWGSFPGRLLAIVSSALKNPGELRSINTPENRKRIRTVTLRHPNELLELVDHYQTSGAYDGAVLDHVTSLQDLVLADILGLNVEDLPVQKSWGLATQQQYGQCTSKCKELIRAMLNLPGNGVIIAQERNFNDEVENRDFLTPTVGAALSPSLTGWLNTAVDYICQTFIRQQEKEVTTKINGKEIKTTQKTKDVEYCLRTAPHAVYTTKFRQPKGYKLPEVIVDPSYDKIMEHIQGR